MKTSHFFAGRKAQALLGVMGMAIAFGLFLTTTAGSQEIPREAELEETIEFLGSEYQLTAQEQIILQPVLYEILLYRKARNEITRQLHEYKYWIDRRREIFGNCKQAILGQGERSLALTYELQWTHIDRLAGRAPELIYNPEAKAGSLYFNSAFTRPWEWVKLSELQDKMRDINNQHRARDEKWKKGDFNIYFSWPETARIIRNGQLEEFDQAEEKKKWDFNEGPEVEAFGVYFPNLEWINRTTVRDRLRATEERLLKMRDEVRNGTISRLPKASGPKDRLFVVPSTRGLPGDLYGWVTKEQVREKIDFLEKRRAEIQNQFKTKTLRISRKHTGWVTQADIEKSQGVILEKANKVGQQIADGDYRVYFPCFFPQGRWFSRNEFDKEIQKIRDRIKTIQADKNYGIPVEGVSGLATREQIEKAVKRDNVTDKQRGYFRISLRRLEVTRALEIDYYQALLNYYERMRSLFFDDSSTVLNFPPRHLMANTAAQPFFLYQKWDYDQRSRFDYEFGHEARVYDDYFKAKTDYLKRCLLEF